MTLETAGIEPEGKALYTRELDRVQLEKARKLLFSGAIISAVFSIIVFLGKLIVF